jgi:hypothetical protein
MNVDIGTEAAQFLFWEHINGILVAVYLDGSPPVDHPGIVDVDAAADGKHLVWCVDVRGAQMTTYT